MEKTKKTVNCIKCKNTTDSTISYRINSSRGRRSSTVYFCSQTCGDNYKKENECQICRYSSSKKNIMPDGYAICSDDSEFMEKPTCHQKYTGIFMCDLCDKESNTYMYVVQNDSHLYDSSFGKNDGEENETYIPTILLCKECYKPYESNSSNSSLFYISSKKYPKILEIDEKYHPHYRYILDSYKTKINSNKFTIKNEIDKLFEEGKNKELNEIYNFIGNLLKNIES